MIDFEKYKFRYEVWEWDFRDGLTSPAKVLDTELTYRQANKIIKRVSKVEYKIRTMLTL